MPPLIRLLSNARSRYFLTSHGINLEYRLKGDSKADTVVLIHGLGTDCRIFLPNLDRLAETYQVLAISLRGHGLSDKPQELTSESFSKENLIRDFIELTWSLNIQAFHLVGHSLGGLIGYEILRQDPTSLLSLVTIAAPAGQEGLKGSARLLQRTARFSLRTFGKRKRQADLAARMVTSNLDTMEFLRNEVFYGTDWEVAKQLKPILSGEDYLDTLAESTVPVLLLEGKNDSSERALGTRRSFQSTLTALADAPMIFHREIPDAGYFPNLDQPNQFHLALLEFWEAQAHLWKA